MPIDWNKEFYSSVLYKTAKTIEHAVKNSVPSSSSPNSNGAYPPGGNTGTPPPYHSAPGAAPYGGNQGVTGSAPRQTTPPPTYYQNPPQSSSDPSATSEKKKSRKKQPLQPVPGKTMIKKIPSVIPFYVVGAVWLLYAIFFPMYRWFDFVIVTAVSIGFYFLSRLVFKGNKFWYPCHSQNRSRSPKSLK